MSACEYQMNSALNISDTNSDHTQFLLCFLKWCTIPEARAALRKTRSLGEGQKEWQETIVQHERIADDLINLVPRAVLAGELEVRPGLTPVPPD